MNVKIHWSLTIVLLLIISTVNSQCTNGNEAACVWSPDENAPLRWIAKTDGVSERWVEVSGCETSKCGSAILQSPWLAPTTRDSTWMLRYKIYGIKNVQLQLSLKTENSGPRQLFFKKGNYADQFPEFWTATKVTLPATPTKHRLLLEAVTPYEKALVAVSDIRTEGLDDEDEENQSEDRLGALEAGFVGGHPELRKGYTRVMDPNICMYP